MKSIKDKQGQPIAWTIAILAGLVAGSLSLATAAESVPAKPATGKARVGVYNSRSVALAYYRSDAWQKQVTSQKAEHDKAKAAGDNKRVAELEKWGSGGQDKAHRQVFGEAPIDNILADMKESLPQIQKQANVEKLVAKAPKDASVEAVDVTSLMVEQFHPSPETLKMIEDMKKHPPLSQDKFPIKD